MLGMFEQEELAFNAKRDGQENELSHVRYRTAIYADRRKQGHQL